MQHAKPPVPTFHPPTPSSDSPSPPCKCFSIGSIGPATLTPLTSLADLAGGGLRFFWRQNVTIEGKKRSTGLVSYPLITLKEGPYKAFDNARKIALGEDILAPKLEIPTVEAFEQYMANRTPEWKQKGTTESKRNRRPLETLQKMFLNHTLQANSPVNAEDVLTHRMFTSALDPIPRNSVIADIKMCINAEMELHPARK